MAIFSVEGPCKVPFDDKPGGRVIVEDLAEFWNRNKKVKNAKGCYVFARRASKGFVPLYVGKTTRTFEQECFTDHKLNHYHRALADYAKGTPVMFFVYLGKAKGAPNKRDIGELEEFLIQVGRTINDRLRNIQGNDAPTWGIKGVLRGGKGKASSAAKEFKKLLKM